MLLNGVNELSQIGNLQKVYIVLIFKKEDIRTRAILTYLYFVHISNCLLEFRIA